MTSLTLGDLALSFQTRQSQARIKADLGRLGTELTTGRTTDLRGATGGDMGALAGIERVLGTLEGYKLAASEAAIFAEGVQRAMETVQETGSDLGASLLQAGGSDEATQIRAVARDARARFATAVSVLNTQVAGRTLLGGTATGGPALADSETMLADLETAIAGETTAAGVEAAVEAWFDTAGGGFETSGYLGSDTPLSAFRVGPNASATVSLTAADQSVRDVLKGFALGALVDAGALDGQTEARGALIRSAATRLLGSDAALAEVRAGIGAAESRIEAARSRNAAEASALEIARNEIVGVDRYQTATDLQAAEAQLESLYTVTARLSRLSLTNYL